VTEDLLHDYTHTHTHKQTTTTSMGQTGFQKLGESANKVTNKTGQIK